MDHINQGKIFLILAHCMLAVVIAVCACAGITRSSAALESSLKEVTTLAEKSQPEGQPEEPAAAAESEKAGSKKVKSKAKGLKDGEYTGTGQGYGGPVTMKLTVKNGTIDSLEVASASGETPAYFNMAKAIIPDIVSSGSANVDGVSGATYSSNGIKAAAAEALKKAGGDGSVSLKKAAPKVKGKNGKDSKKKKYSKPAGGWKDGRYTGSARGFGGAVNVTVTIKDGKITSISTSGKNETASYWSRAQAVKGKIIKAQNPRVDAVSGATYSSNGIINAVIGALSKAGKKGPKDQVITTSREEYTVTAGSSVSLGAKAKTSLRYRSSRPSVVKVSGKGRVTAVAGGRAVITITAQKSSKYKKSSKKVTVTVQKREQKITVSGHKAGSTVELEEADIGTTVSLAGSSESGRALSYLSDAPETAVVDNNGTVTITGTGRARITISAPSTKVYEKASCVIFIKVKSADGSDETDKISGIFNGRGKGYGGDVTAAVTIEDSLIKAISVEGKNETDKYWFKAKKITSNMIKKQTWDVDAVSGATLSSNGIRDAVKQALQEAGLIS